MRTLGVFLTLIVSAAFAPAFGAGEPVNGFPSWSERVIFEWINRARSDPQFEMSRCGGNCGEAACYSPMPPLAWSDTLSHAARFHADHMARLGYFAHDSACSLVSNIGSLYPSACDGSVGCSCQGGVRSGSTSVPARVGLFGASYSGEIIATPADPDQAFYLWLFEPSASTTCAFSMANGHRWLILRSNGSMGAGVGISNSVVDFGTGTVPTKIVSGAHYPRQAPTVNFWANWYDSAGPLSAFVYVNGVAYPMTRARGSAANGAWTTAVSGVGSGCHRYYFQFIDSAGAIHRYPTTGSYGLGPAGTCADWALDTAGGDASISADFDGDRITDRAVFRSSTGTWWIRRSSGGTMAQSWGTGGDIPVAADYNGDGKTDNAVWRPSTGTWWVRFDTGATTTANWGISSDVPVPADYDGDGRSDFAVWRPSTGTWWVMNSTGGTSAQPWGLLGDKPVPADYDGDNVIDRAVWRPSTGTWWVLRSSGGAPLASQWGDAADIPIPGKYDTDSRADFAVWRPGTFTFWIQRTTGGVDALPWGTTGDRPLVGDHNGDGRRDYIVWRPSTGMWWTLFSNTGAAEAVSWGTSGDTPLSEAAAD